MIRPAPKPAPSEKKPRKRLQAHKRLTSKTPIRKINKARMDKRTKAYRSYMASSAWKQLRLACLARDNWTCQECGWKDATAGYVGELIESRQLHAAHKTYARFGHELLSDLVTKCDDCHLNKEHGSRFVKPRMLRAG